MIRAALRNWRAGHTFADSARLAIAAALAADLLRRAYARKD